MYKEFVNKIVLISVFLIAFANGANAQEMSYESLIKVAKTLEILSQPFSTWDQITLKINADGPAYRDEILKVDGELYLQHFYIFPDRAWKDSTGQALLAQPSQIFNSSTEDIRKLLGMISRTERFSPGTYGTAIMNGVYKNALTRIQAEIIVLRSNSVNHSK